MESHNCPPENSEFYNCKSGVMPPCHWEYFSNPFRNRKFRQRRRSYNSNEFWWYQNYENYRNTTRKRYVTKSHANPHFPCVSLETRAKWLVNLTEESIPEDVLDVVCLGKEFGVPLTRKQDVPVHHIIAGIESHMRFIEVKQRNEVRRVCVNLISNFLNEKQPRHSKLMQKVQSAKAFKNKNPHILFLKADKGNVSVAVTHATYISKMSELLNDTKTYRIIRQDPTQNIQSTVNKLLQSWWRSNFISETSKLRLWSRHGTKAFSYGLPKIHKENVPFRMIVSFIGTPTYHLAKYIQKILSDCMKEEVRNISGCKQSITNSVSLVTRIRNLHLPKDFAMISMDVVSLFTNIPLQLVIAGVRERWARIAKYTSIPEDQFIEAICLCFSASAFQFNGTMYQQVFGAAMGSPLSPIVAEIVLQDLENFCLKRLDFPVYFYTRYVDDVLTFVPRDKAQSILACFNSYHERLKFTLELEVNRCINFLEVTLIRCGGKIAVDWYRKPTFSGRYLSYHSHHPRIHKITTIYNLVDRGILLSDHQFHLKNINFIRQALKDNGYPLKIIIRTLNRRRARLLRPRDCNAGESLMNGKNPARVVLPYVKGLSEALQRNLRKFDISLSFRNDSNLRWLFTGNKDQLSHLQQVNTVYKISCLDCDFILIEHTKKPLGARLKELYRGLRQPHNYPISNGVTEHAFRYIHDFNFEEVTVLAVESDYRKRDLLALSFREEVLPQGDQSVERISHDLREYVESTPMSGWLSAKVDWSPMLNLDWGYIVQELTSGLQL